MSIPQYHLPQYSSLTSCFLIFPCWWYLSNSVIIIYWTIGPASNYLENLKKKIYLSFVPLCVLTLKCDRVGRETLTQMHILHSMFIAQCLHSLKQSETCQIGDLACMACLLTCWGSWQEGSLIYVCCYVFLSFFFQTENVVEEGHRRGRRGRRGGSRGNVTQRLTQTRLSGASPRDVLDL